MEHSIIIRQGLKELSADDITHIQDVAKRFPKLSRKELARTICEHLSWFSPSGGSKITGCLTLLERLSEQNLITLPPKKNCKRKTRDKPPTLTSRTIEKSQIVALLKESLPIKLQVLNNKSDIALWNEYVQRYHPLKYRRPFGHWLRYFLLSGNEILGCIQISGAAKALHHRDQWIGWNTAERRKNLSWIINNSRFLILPWVKIPNLASHALAQLTRHVADDWGDRWGYRPVSNDAEIVTKKAKHAWISSRPLNSKNIHDRCNLGARSRWGIETIFLVEKHQGYSYEHCFGRDWSAVKGYHYLMRLAHVFNTLARFSKALSDYYKEYGVRGFITFVYSTFCGPWFDTGDVETRLLQPFHLSWK